ncbi:hypothetical protein BGX28_006605 [Mortierella sp. GBA30]|nr:hypothetical protein BGX28_006605 [Mortierella sp. GBA30]
MKKLNISLLGGISEQSGFYLPGDTLGGLVQLNTTSSIKCTCIKIQFTGNVTTRVAKASEDVYVLNQQVVLLGNANNATEEALEEGKHSWPFEFTIPHQHLPSTGKYRHGAVKYSLNATMISGGFMGLVQELKASLAITVRDMINIRLQPYSAPVVVKGESNTQPKSNKPRDLAIAAVSLSRSAYLKGQVVHIEIDLSHPSKINRNPGCFIQLIRKEQYYAGDQAKEFRDTIATCTEDLIVNSSMNTGKIFAEIVIPKDAQPSMTTTKIIAIEYHLNILFDMRAKTGLFESKHKKKVNSKMRNKLLSSPGGFEVKVPLIVGTLSDSLHIQKPSPFSQLTRAESAESSIKHSPIAVPANSTPSSPSPSQYSVPAVTTPPQSELPSYTPPLIQNQSMDLITGHAKGLSLPNNNATNAPYRNRSHSDIPTFNTYALHSAAGQPPSPPSMSLNKPLPTVPHMATTFHRGPLPLGSIASTLAPAPGLAAGIGSGAARGLLPWSGSGSGSASSSSLSPQHPSNFHPLRRMSAVDMPLGQNEYPLEKNMPETRPRNLPLPISMQVETPTAPRAVDLGLGPASPQIHYSSVWNRGRRSSAPSSPSLGSAMDTLPAGDYFQFRPATDSKREGRGQIQRPGQGLVEPPGSSILSGLSPDVIMEICSRAISFWTYQTSQEAKFQEVTQRSLEDKLSLVEKRLQRMTREVNTELNGFRDTVGTLQKEVEQEKRRSADLTEQLEEKTRQLSKLQVMTKIPAELRTEEIFQAVGRCLLQAINRDRNPLRVPANSSSFVYDQPNQSSVQFGTTQDKLPLRTPFPFTADTTKPSVGPILPIGTSVSQWPHPLPLPERQGEGHASGLSDTRRQDFPRI